MFETWPTDAKALACGAKITERSANVRFYQFPKTKGGKAQLWNVVGGWQQSGLVVSVVNWGTMISVKRSEADKLKGRKDENSTAAKAKQ